MKYRAPSHWLPPVWLYSVRRLTARYEVKFERRNSGAKDWVRWRTLAEASAYAEGLSDSGRQSVLRDRWRGHSTWYPAYLFSEIS